MMPRVFYRTLAALLVALPAAALAQGTLSTQGFGYPTGQLSTRTLGTGGALGEIDPLSVSNPSSLINFGGAALYFQAEPEYRKLSVNGRSESSTIARYPLILASVPITGSLVAGISATNLLDRTFTTVTRTTVNLSGTDIGSTNTFSSDGSIADVRLALAWAPKAWLHLGAAAHAITGDNRLNRTQVFDDSTRFARLVDTNTVTYVGNAFSGGVELYAGQQAVFAASYRAGGSMSLKHGDTTLAHAHVPDQLALSAAYLGIRGTTLAVRTAHESWSRMNGLGSAAVSIHDGWDTSVGADVLGPRFANHSLQLRGGGRWRTLPFGVGAQPVRERSLSLGVGTLIARGRAAVDVAGIRAARDATGVNASESSWTLSFGITVRP
ncbi:MAG TPA: hypothetical protein VFP15_04680 [Gemmatimonadaceae bacterium]|nr:hypothetical protein [Gemmatimonadaceae bacterium]